MNFKEQALILYKKVFCEDSEEFAQNFTDRYFDKCCRYIISGGKLVSMLYLLDCSIFDGEKTYSAKYLYAAATHPDYQHKGLMSNLIKSALAEEKNIVTKPATRELFSFYEKFGFKVCSYSTGFNVCVDERFKVSDKEYIYYRNMLLENTPHITLEDMDFALAGIELYANDNFCAAFDRQEQKVKEYISKDKEKLLGDIPFAMWTVENPICNRVYFGMAMD